MIRFFAAASLAAFVWLLVESALLVRETRRQVAELPRMASAKIDAAVEKADLRIGEASALLDARIGELGSRADARIRDLVQASERQISEAVLRADARLGEALAEVRGVRVEAQSALSEVRGLVADVRGTHSEYVRRIDYFTDCGQNGLCWQGVFTDMLMAGRRAALTFDREIPKVAEAMTQTAQASAKTTEASAQIAANLATATRPYPRWVRWGLLGLTVAPAAAQVALPFVMRRTEAQQAPLPSAPLPGN